MPAISHLVESALYVADLPRAVAFYRDVLGLPVMDQYPNLVSFDAGRQTVLLLFERGTTINGTDLPIGHIPGHNGSGKTHFAFAIAATDLAEWTSHLAAAGIAIESRVTWPRGGTSLYFRDPDGHAVELITPGIWPNY